MVPAFGRRRIPPRFVIVVASLGAAAVTLIIGVTAVQLVAATLQGTSNPILQVQAGWLPGGQVRGTNTRQPCQLR